MKPIPTCRFCRAELIGRRSDTEFCKDACRKAFARHAEQTRAELPPEEISADGNIKTWWEYCEEHDWKYSLSNFRVPGEVDMWLSGGGGCLFCNDEARKLAAARDEAQKRLDSAEGKEALFQLKAQLMQSYEPEIMKRAEEEAWNAAQMMKASIAADIRAEYGSFVGPEAVSQLMAQYTNEALEAAAPTEEHGTETKSEPTPQEVTA